MAWDVMSGVTKMAWDVMSGVTKTAWDVLTGVANLCGMFCPGCKKMAWDVLSRDVLSGSPVETLIKCTKGYSASKRTRNDRCGSFFHALVCQMIKVVLESHIVAKQNC